MARSFDHVEAATLYKLAVNGLISLLSQKRLAPRFTSVTWRKDIPHDETFDYAFWEPYLLKLFNDVVRQNARIDNQKMHEQAFAEKLFGLVGSIRGVAVEIADIKHL